MILTWFLIGAQVFDNRLPIVAIATCLFVAATYPAVAVEAPGVLWEEH